MRLSWWGCELKCTRILSYGILGGVSLLVRLWVEISYTSLDICPCAPSASLWGCELKCVIPFCYKPVKIRQPPCEAVSWNEIGESHKLNSPVSLLVRLWVEISFPVTLYPYALSQPPCEAVSWNTTLSNAFSCVFGQPPCEAVSWNAPRVANSVYVSSSASLWGCELKFCYFFPGHSLLSQPPCEAVSWNAEFLEFDCFIVTAK